MKGRLGSEFRLDSLFQKAWLLFCLTKEKEKTIGMDSIL
jgi:hypothetical protein